MAIQNITNIPAPRVPFVDERTGLISREWYRFLLNLFTLTGSGQDANTIADVLVSPTAVGQAPELDFVLGQAQIASLIARYDQVIDDLSVTQVPVIPQDDLSPRQELGTLASQDASNVSLTGGAMSGISMVLLQAPTASAPPYIMGGVYFDTTLNKMRVGGASAWETVTSI